MVSFNNSCRGRFVFDEKGRLLLLGEEIDLSTEAQIWFMKLTSVKTQLVIFLTGFALFLAARDREALFLLTTFIAVISAAGADLAFSYFKNAKLALTESPVISGLIIGYVVSSDQPWWIFAAGAFLAIASKHLIRLNKRHIFNPAALGIFLSILIFNIPTQWKGAYLWYVIAPFGLYFIYKIHKLSLLFGYALATLVLFGTQAILQKAPLINIFGYLNYFFIFIMLIEPKTTPIKTAGKVIFGIVTAVLIFILTGVGVKFDVELSSPLIMNMFVPLLNKIT